jgi:hypothetical protein
MRACKGKKKINLTFEKLLPNGRSRDSGHARRPPDVGRRDSARRPRPRPPCHGAPQRRRGGCRARQLPHTARGGAATLEAAGNGQERDLDSFDAVDEQRIPRLLNRRREPAGGEAQRARPGSVALDAGGRAARVNQKSAI